MATTNAKLKGNPPETFDGNRKNSLTFLRQFALWKALNHTDETFTTPYLRVALALSYIRGPSVDLWVENELKDLEHQVHPAPGIAPNYTINDKALWTDF